MKHTHDYEAYLHPELTEEAKALGIKAVELRKCKACGKEMTFIWTRDGWHPLFEDREAEGQDILLA